MNKQMEKNRCGTWLVQAFLLPVFLVLGVQSQSFAQTTNLALNHPVFRSAVQDGNEVSYAASFAVDGYTNTRWSSPFSDPQWIYVDLGATYNLTRVVLTWETAYSLKYQLQVSNDATNWTTVFNETAGNGATDDISLSSATGRYVRMYSTARGTIYGNSLWEFAVYGSTSTVSDTTPPPAPQNVVITPTSITAVKLSWNPSIDVAGQNGAAPSGVVGYNVYRNGVKTNASLITATTYNDTSLSGVLGTVYSYTVRAMDAKNNESGDSATVASDDPPNWAALTAGKTKYTAYTSADLLSFAQNSPVPAGSVVVIKNNPTSTAYNWGTISIKTNGVIYTAETAGNVKFTGAGTFFVVGSNNTFGGFVFDQATGSGTNGSPIVLSNYDPNNNQSSCTDSGALSNRITGNTFKRSGSASVQTLPLIYVRHRSHDNRVDHNVFDSSFGPAVAIYDSDSSYSNDAQCGQSKRLRVDHNTFNNASLGSATAPKTEVFRTGSLVHATLKFTTNVYFEFNSLTGLPSNGYGELVLNKSIGNFYRYNTFTNVAGGIFLRHGDGNQVNGNRFVDSSAGGGFAIWICGGGHSINNNIIDTPLHSAAIYMPNWGTGTGTFCPLPNSNSVIAHNTILNFNGRDGSGNSGWGISVGYRDGGMPNSPSNNQFRDNILRSTATNAGSESGLVYLSSGASAQNNALTNNLFYTGGNVPLGRGYTPTTANADVIQKDPKITTYNVLPADSFAKDVGVAVSGITVDYNGKPRVVNGGIALKPDIGAVEYQP